MNYLKKNSFLPAIALMSFAMLACSDHDVPDTENQQATITVENVLSAKPLVQSGTFQGTGTPPVILPGQSVAIKFYAAKGQAITFATMYGWSNDLFFAPENPGIQVYGKDGVPIEGDVSSQIKLWDNGTRINQTPGAGLSHPGVASNDNVNEVKDVDAQGNTFLKASALVKGILKYEGNSGFTLTLTNTSGGTANETPLSPGVWAVSYIAGGQLLNPAPLFTPGKASANGLTSIAEAGQTAPLTEYLKTITGVFTPLSPVLVVIYNGIDNPVFKNGEKDRGEGLKQLAQQGNADMLAATLRAKPGVKNVYVLAASGTKILLPAINGQAGSSVSQNITVTKGDRVAIATMYGFSNDWFFASSGSDATIKGDLSTDVKLYDNGTAVDQFPGAGITQFNLDGTPLTESKPIQEVPNPNAFITLPGIPDIIKVTVK